MKKAVYSLVLSEDVVEAVDRMAYARGTSRSNLINQLLAEAVGYVTPERRMAEILHTLSEQMTGLFQLQEQATDGMLTIRSPLRYRYKPTIRYRVELYRQPEHAIGVMHASFRTQNHFLKSGHSRNVRTDFAVRRITKSRTAAGTDGSGFRQDRRQPRRKSVPQSVSTSSASMLR